MEVNAKELRIGNFILWDGNFYEVKASFFDQYEGTDIRKIPLTEELLLKFGFEKNRNLQWIIGLTNKDCLSEFILKHNSIYGFRLDQEGCYGFSEIKYVHQLQNIFFTLTEEELILKE